MSRTFKVMFARFPGNQQEHPASAGWMMDTLLKAAADPRIGRANIVPFRVSDTPITMVRNLAVKLAQQAKCDYLLMLDSDMQPDLPGEQPFWDVAWEFMMQRREEEQAVVDANHRDPETARVPEYVVPPATIAAPYCGPPPHENVYVFKWATLETEDPNPNFKLEQFTREEAAVRTGIEEVAALPTGLILYDMRVFDKLPPPWFEYEWADEPYRTRKASTEDCYQTRNASLLGMPQYVAWQCWAGHVKLKTVIRPQIITRDHVSAALRRAWAQPFESGDRIMVLPGEPAVKEAVEANGDA